MLQLREASVQDFDAFYSIKADKNNILWGGFSSAPYREKFLEWYKKQLDKSSKRKLCIFSVDYKDIGFSSIDYSYEVPEISYGVLSEETGNGYGTQIIKLTCSVIDSHMVQAFVSDRNIGSIRCFEKNGFIKTSVCDTRYLASFDESHVFYKWIKVLR